ncbi:MAG: hypothetical protein HQL38_16915 [Alphaproteobacteria bacterium]|nr:hypothetical protein [Alphaproteobacteria bacterium]
MTVTCEKELLWTEQLPGPFGTVVIVSCWMADDEAIVVADLQESRPLVRNERRRVNRMIRELLRGFVADCNVRQRRLVEQQDGAGDGDD